MSRPSPGCNTLVSSTRIFYRFDACKFRLSSIRNSFTFVNNRSPLGPSSTSLVRSFFLSLFLASYSIVSYTNMYKKFHFREEKINQLCTVMGANWRMTNPNYDPDRAYELTTDNVKKIMAIHMRFRYV